MVTANQIATAWYAKRCAYEAHRHARRLRLARAIVANPPAPVSPEPPTTNPPKTLDPTQIPPIQNHAVQPPRDPELKNIPKEKAVEWLHQWFVKAPFKVGASFVKSYYNFLMATADGPRTIMKLMKKLIKPEKGQPRWTKADTEQAMAAVADMAKVPFAAVYFGMVPTPFPKPWAWYTPFRVQQWKEGKGEPTKLEKLLLPSRYLQKAPGKPNPSVQPPSETPVPQPDPSGKSASLRTLKIPQVNRRVRISDHQSGGSKSRSARETRRLRR